MNEAVVLNNIIYDKTELEELLFYEKDNNGILCRGFYPKENREHIAGEIMSKVFELSEQIRERYIQEGKTIL